MYSNSSARRIALLGIAMAGSWMGAWGQQPIFSAGRIYDDTRIGAIAYPLGQGALNLPGSAVLQSQNTVPFGTDGFVGMGTLIHSDNRTEMFPAHRMNGWVDQMDRPTYPDGTPRPPNNNKPKQGTWANFFRFQDTETPRFTSGVSNEGRDNFFTSSFPYNSNRQFSGSTYNRGYSKVEYICPAACGTPNFSTYYFKIGGWNMSAKANNEFPIPSGLSPVDLIGMDAVIHSDGDTPDYIVDKLAHVGNFHSQGLTTPALLMKGGGIWFGFGCSQAPCGEAGQNTNPRIHLFAGATQTIPGQAKTSYRGGSYRYKSTESNTSIPYTSVSRNRGWVKVEFTNKPPRPYPYAIKSKAVALGSWNMQTVEQRKIGLVDFGIVADRIVGLNTAIQSDPTYNIWNDRAGWQVSDPNMHNYETPPSDPEYNASNSGGGGFTIVRDDTVNVAMARRNGGNVNYYSTKHSLTNSGGVEYNRGWVKIDYLAGSCEQGPTGFKIQAVPGTLAGDCSGSGSPFTFEGGGNDIFGNVDDFAFMHKAAGVDQDIQVKIETQAAAQGWAKSGIMIRENLGAGARHASILVTPANGAHLNWRAANPGSTSRKPAPGEPNNAVKAPYFLRLVKSGTTFTAYARKLSTDGWTTIGSTVINGFPSTYYYGLAQSSYDRTLAKSTFSGFTTKLASGAYFKVLNRNSGKALEVGGSSTADGAAVQQWNYAGGNNQQWQMSDLGNGYYKITARHSGKALEIGGSSTVDGAKAQQWNYAGGNNQQWQVADLGAGYYRITARHSGKALEIGSSSTADGAKAQQWGYAGSNAQQWQILAP
jgi:hypothetical protein